MLARPYGFYAKRNGKRGYAKNAENFLVAGKLAKMSVNPFKSVEHLKNIARIAGINIIINILDNRRNSFNNVCVKIFHHYFDIL